MSYYLNNIGKIEEYITLDTTLIDILNTANSSIFKINLLAVRCNITDYNLIQQFLDNDFQNFKLNYKDYNRVRNILTSFIVKIYLEPNKDFLIVEEMYVVKNNISLPKELFEVINNYYNFKIPLKDYTIYLICKNNLWENVDKYRSKPIQFYQYQNVYKKLKNRLYLESISSERIYNKEEIEQFLNKETELFEILGKIKFISPIRLTEILDKGKNNLTPTEVEYIKDTIQNFIYVAYLQPNRYQEFIDDLAFYKIEKNKFDFYINNYYINICINNFSRNKNYPEELYDKRYKEIYTWIKTYNDVNQGFKGKKSNLIGGPQYTSNLDHYYEIPISIGGGRPPLNRPIWLFTKYGESGEQGSFKNYIIFKKLISDRITDQHNGELIYEAEDVQGNIITKSLHLENPAFLNACTFTPYYSYIEVSDNLMDSINTPKFNRLYLEELSEPLYCKGYYLNTSVENFKKSISLMLKNFNIEPSSENIEKAIKSLKTNIL